MQFVDTILVAYSVTSEKDSCVMTVGRKKLNGSVDIINAFQGEEAKYLYKKLTTVKNSKGES